MSIMSSVPLQQKLLGVCKCSTALVCCPVFSAVSFTGGVIYTASAFLTLECCSDHFTKKRDQICMCCGLATGLFVSSSMIIDGWNDYIGEQKSVKIFPSVESDMIR
jgi:uncharacterized PurR-regulated membrane protein YhhQ (DUF165 family)